MIKTISSHFDNHSSNPSPSKNKTSPKSKSMTVFLIASKTIESSYNNPLINNNSIPSLNGTME
jgi:hypothetical protein